MVYPQYSNEDDEVEGDEKKKLQIRSLNTRKEIHRIDRYIVGDANAE